MDFSHIENIRSAAEKGDLDSQFRLAKIYASFNELFMAAVWFERAAKGGHADAQLETAKLYERGAAVEKNADKAAYWFKMSESSDL